ncbi:MAG: hypothetical protein QOJ26_1338 [Thermoplasmata archaeon]|jgi:hypothetical protein|nr:hypothetical protein [Thermoplasmata archaeon]MEA3166466.1 hypothetical protein [Thermoplasmata archaeon]
MNRSNAVERFFQFRRTGMVVFAAFNVIAGAYLAWSGYWATAGFMAATATLLIAVLWLTRPMDIDRSLAKSVQQVGRGPS